MGFFDSKPKRKKILLAEDDMDIVKLYKSFFDLHVSDMDLIVALDKKEFTDKFNECDMVISDFHMKDISFKFVRGYCEGKKPLLLISGDIFPYYKYQLSKPVNAKTIIGVVRKMLEDNIICPVSSGSKKVA